MVWFLHLAGSRLFHWSVHASVRTQLNNFSFVEREVTITKYEPHGDDMSQHVQAGNSVEVRGLVRSATEVQYSDLNRFEGDFDMGTYEQMLDYYHGMCTHLCVQQEAR